MTAQNIAENKVSFRTAQEKRNLISMGLCVICGINNYKHKTTHKCDTCTKAYDKERRERYRTAEYTPRTQDKLRYRYMEIYKDARKRDKIFNLSYEYVVELLIGNCKYCGISGKLGIDRIDSNLGYIEGNVVSCCKTCNFAKRTMTEKEFYSWINRIAIHNGYMKTEK